MNAERGALDGNPVHSSFIVHRSSLIESALQTPMQEQNELVAS
jgi:hypothetical protein